MHPIMIVRILQQIVACAGRRFLRPATKDAARVKGHVPSPVITKAGLEELAALQQLEVF
jgi:hypothetical protein